MAIKYKAITKDSYETHDGSIEFELTINGKTATGYWRPIFQYTKNGVDVNDLFQSDKKQFSIFENGGNLRRYEIYAEPILAEKQPKNLRFTGHTLSIKHFKEVFISKITDALNGKGKAQLSNEFLNYFDIHILDTPFFKNHIGAFNGQDINDIKEWARDKDEFQKVYKKLLSDYRKYIHTLSLFKIPENNEYLIRILAENKQDTALIDWLEKQSKNTITLISKDNGTRGTKMSNTVILKTDTEEFKISKPFILDQFWYL
ncbi:MAG: hypothetical protein WC055_09970 [Melioribacteraceae bacterium]